MMLNEIMTTKNSKKQYLENDGLNMISIGTTKSYSLG